MSTRDFAGMPGSRPSQTALLAVLLAIGAGHANSQTVCAAGSWAATSADACAAHTTFSSAECHVDRIVSGTTTADATCGGCNNGSWAVTSAEACAAHTTFSSAECPADRIVVGTATADATCPACLRAVANYCDEADGQVYITSARECSAAAITLGLDDVTASAVPARSPLRPKGCYWKASNYANTKLWFNVGGEPNRQLDGYGGADRFSICGKHLLAKP